MSSAKLTLIGMYEWDNTLFSELTVPEGIDKDLFIDNLLLFRGEFEVLYGDPDFMKSAIKVWGLKWARTFAQWLRGTQSEFNPIYNYDRFEDIRDEERKKFDSKTTADYNDSRTVNLEDKRTADLTEERTPDLTEESTLDNTDTTSQTTDATTEHQVAAYDSSTYQNSSKDTINNGVSEVAHSGTVTNTTTGTDTNTTTGTDTMNHTGTDKLNRKGTLSDTGGSEQNTNIHTAHMYGNIGVTTSAAMLKEFYDISTWNLYNHMADVFAQELLIPVY